MIDQIRELARPAFYSCTERFSVERALGRSELVLLDCESDPPTIITVVAGVPSIVKTASDDDLKRILEWLQSHPQHELAMSPLQCLERFNTEEQTNIEKYYPSFARQLFAATGDVPWERYAAAVEALAAAGVLSASSRDRHLGPREK